MQTNTTKSISVRLTPQQTKWLLNELSLIVANDCNKLRDATVHTAIIHHTEHRSEAIQIVNQIRAEQS